MASLLPDPSNLYYRLAGAQAITGHAETAIEIFRRMIEVGIYRDPRQIPTSPRWWASRASPPISSASSA